VWGSGRSTTRAPAPPSVSRALAAQQGQLYDALQNFVRLGMGVPRQELECRAGGNFSWNAGVDYRQELARSGQQPLVAALYRAAGLDLRADLDRLAAAPRIAADADAVAYAKENGEISVPVLTMNTTGDPSVIPAHSQAYERVVRHAGDADLLRSTFVHAIEHRLDTADRRGHRHWDGRWTLLSFTLPEFWQRQRHELRTRLLWAGFGPLQGGLWIAPRRPWTSSGCWPGWRRAGTCAPSSGSRTRGWTSPRWSARSGTSRISRTGTSTFSNGGTAVSPTARTPTRWAASWRCRRSGA
jgi:hypothetical protein